MTDYKLRAREAVAAAALRPWLTPWGAARGWLLLAGFIFAANVVPRLLIQTSGPDFVRWLAVEAGGALLTSAGALIVGFLTAWVGGSMILAWRRRRGD